MQDIRLYVNLGACEPIGLEPEMLEGAAGLVIDSDRLGLQQARELPAPVAVARVAAAGPGAGWCEHEEITWVCEAGLEPTAGLRDAWPELQWVPRLAVYKPEVRYRFNDTALGEGFRFYVPDTAAIHGYRVKGSRGGLEQALERAEALGFASLWLHALDAQAAASGLDLDLAERAGRYFAGDIWLSGGASEARHLANLSRQGGVAAVVVSSELAADTGCGQLKGALGTVPETGVPVHFAQAGKGATRG